MHLKTIFTALWKKSESWNLAVAWKVPPMSGFPPNSKWYINTWDTSTSCPVFLTSDCINYNFWKRKSVDSYMSVELTWNKLSHSKVITLFSSWKMTSLTSRDPTFFIHLLGGSQKSKQARLVPQVNNEWTLQRNLLFKFSWFIYWVFRFIGENTGFTYPWQIHLNHINA